MVKQCWTLSRKCLLYSMSQTLSMPFESNIAFNLQVPTNYYFDCTDRCKENLSKRAHWMEERRFCIETLTRLYGYMPLLHTQSRVDPVTTEIPKIKEFGTCFKPVEHTQGTNWLEIASLLQEWKALHCDAHAWVNACAVPLIDGLGLVLAWSLASSRRVWRGLTTLLDSMREAILHLMVPPRKQVQCACAFSVE